MSEAPTALRADLGQMIRCAALAPSGHNAQPWLWSWRESPGGATVSLQPDPARRLPLADPQDRELWISLGCAMENLEVAAHRLQYACTWTQRPPFQAELRRVRRLEPTFHLYDALLRRHTSRRPLLGMPPPPHEKRELVRLASDGCELRLLEWEMERREAAALIDEAHRQQMNSPGFRAELESWFRFNRSEVEQHRDGLCYYSCGLPSLPRWLGRRLLRFGPSPGSRVAKAPMVAVFCAHEETPASWAAVGRAFERFALALTALDFKHAHANAACQCPATRADLRLRFALDGQPCLLIPVGRCAVAPQSPRRRQDPSTASQFTMKSCPRQMAGTR